MRPGGFFFFFNDTATTEIYTLSLHDALPILVEAGQRDGLVVGLEQHAAQDGDRGAARHAGDRKSTRLNSSHSQISYAVFCLKKKNSRSALKKFTLIFCTFLIDYHASP